MEKIFISYTHADESFVKKLRTGALVKRGQLTLPAFGM
jgi:hypothetical protein